MSRIAKMPVLLADKVTLNVGEQGVMVKGPKGAVNKKINAAVKIETKDKMINFSMHDPHALSDALAGTARAIINKMVLGVTDGFVKELELMGVGYRAQVQGKKLNLTLGFSHPVVFDIPEGINIETPSQTEIMIKGVDCDLVGQVAAKIRRYRPPEPYKGKGVRYKGERIILKETKKK
ncbi:MAG: 50S ribosomal protein L6 [uncultured bacterium]|nr:MAG: 50S ribosomal protein L6 [uncultured bacterium]OGT16843.1 MAG: 50S ribosomal protein L6 [Gammaproteobacteria bacterium RIFCSPHIGHO2_02_FULL_38_33]OGT23911.1 MAG: 50S ribosomal protein L6 [Gammaproteobacteria bacterium RIFCSPHIGHO2_12_38_15]OGT67121.1 MAG: 50S ribosomal protein L6 [Gammaproteobacteria bacterium RIFCSPLOWO2_02_FULL_38_11]OGT76116.1 MAG: 50S ribosomal protein L6 [Gammaproteobacteria bacterium RIFCSPLOWO2_12_FULL_38_14]